MDEAKRVIDPFGAPEFFCQDAIFEMAAPGIVRVLMVSQDGEGELIVKAKVLMPFATIGPCIANATAFTALQAVKAVLGSAAPLHLM